MKFKRKKPKYCWWVVDTRRAGWRVIHRSTHRSVAVIGMTEKWQRLFKVEAEVMPGKHWTEGHDN